MLQGDWVEALEALYDDNRRTINRGQHYFVHKTSHGGHYVHLDCDDDIRRGCDVDKFKRVTTEEDGMDRVEPGCYLKAKITTTSLTKGIVYKVEHASGRDHVFLVDRNGKYRKENFTFWSKPDTVEQENSMKGTTATTQDSRWVTPQDDKSWRDYEFIIRHEEQVDTELIRQDLSQANPLMIAEIEGSTRIFVFIAQCLWTKAFNCKGSKRLRKELDDLIWGEGDPGRMERDDLPKLISVLKRIKAAQWKKGTQAKCTVRKVKV